MPKTDTNDLELGVTSRGVAAEQKLFGRYTLRKVLGRGGMGIVWLAHDDELKRNVAMKFLPDMIIRDREAVEDLKRETRRSLDLTHHHIVRIYDFTQDDTCAAIVMEYVDGDSLSALKTHQATGCFGVSALQVWAGHFCQALDYAHRQARVVHRDLKPANLMVNSRGDLKVTDFGISRSMSDSMTRVSISNSAGTLAYMSPEQALGAPPAVGDDIYAFGATIFDLLTGRPPFFRGNLQVQLETVIPPPMEARRTELGNSGEPIPPLWEEVIAACLSKRPQDRPHTMGEIAALLGVGSSSSSGTSVTHGGFGGGIPGTSRTSFAPGTSTTDQTISPEEMVTAQVRSKPSSVTPRTGTQGPAPVPTRAEDVFLNIAPARTPTAPPPAAVPPTAPRRESTVGPAPTNRTATPAPAVPVEHATPTPPIERVAPVARVERITSPAPPAPASAAEQSAAVPEPKVEATPVFIPEQPVIPEAIDPPATPPALLEEISEAVALKPAESPASPRVPEDELVDEPLTMPGRKRVSEGVAPAAGAEEAPVPVATPASQTATPGPAEPSRIPEPPAPFPVPSGSPYQGVGHRIGSPRKKSAVPLIAAAVGAMVLIGGLVTWFATHPAKPVAEKVVPPAPPPPPPVPTESETLTVRAKELREDGELQEARLSLARALALDPANQAAAKLLDEVDRALAEEKMSADLEAKKTVLARVDLALQASDFANAKRLLETVPPALANDPDVVAKNGEIVRLETDARTAIEKKMEEQRPRVAENVPPETEPEPKPAAVEKVRPEEPRPAPPNRTKKDEKPSRKKPTPASKPKNRNTDEPPPERRIARQLPTPTPQPSRPSTSQPKGNSKGKRSGPSSSTIF